MLVVSGNLLQNYFRPPLDPISIPTTLPNKATENKREKRKTTTDIKQKAVFDGYRSADEHSIS